MQRDFSKVEDNFVSVPAGTYVCRVADVRPGRARDGSARWSLRLEVVGGDWSGKTAAWDSITWSERGVFRVKRVLESLGFDVSGTLDVEPEELVDRKARVQVALEEWEDPISGRRQVRTTVPFLGYGPAEPDALGSSNGAGNNAGNGSGNGSGNGRGGGPEPVPSADDFDPFAAE